MAAAARPGPAAAAIIGTVMPLLDSRVCSGVLEIFRQGGVATVAYSDVGSENHKQEFRPDHVHDAAVPLLCLGRDIAGEVCVETSTFWGHHTVEGENEWCEGSVFDIHNPVVVFALLCGFMLGKYLFRR